MKAEVEVGLKFSGGSELSTRRCACFLAVSRRAPVKAGLLLLILILSSSPGKCHNDISQIDVGEKKERKKKKRRQNGKSLDTEYENSSSLQCSCSSQRNFPRRKLLEPLKM